MRKCCCTFQHIGAQIRFRRRLTGHPFVPLANRSVTKHPQRFEKKLGMEEKSLALRKPVRSPKNTLGSARKQIRNCKETLNCNRTVSPDS